jgi:hypothetical protein
VGISVKPAAGGFFVAARAMQRRLSRPKEVRVENVWLESAVWLGLALLAAIVSIRVAVSVALIEIVIGASAGNALCRSCLCLRILPGYPHRTDRKRGFSS